MTRRKSRRKVVTNSGFIKKKLETSFTCPFCNGEDCCTVKMMHKLGKAKVECCLCHENFQALITHLSEPIDVYNEWVDACEEVNRE